MNIQYLGLRLETGRENIAIKIQKIIVGRSLLSTGNFSSLLVLLNIVIDYFLYRMIVVVRAIRAIRVHNDISHKT